MEITSVTVHMMNKENSNHKAMASIVFDDCFKIEGIRIIEGHDKMIVAMPTRKKTNGTEVDAAHPTNTEFRLKVNKAILDEYEKVKDNQE